MLTTLFPSTYTRYTSLPVLGSVLEDLCSWLPAQGYPVNAIIRRIQGAPLLDQCLRQRDVHTLSGYTAEQLRMCFPREDRWTPQIAYSLGRSLLSYLKQYGTLATTPTASETLIDGYRQHLERVRGLAASTIWRHADLASDFLRFLGYDDDLQRLARIQVVDLERFIAEVSLRVGRITMQKVIAIMRSFLRFLSVSGRAPAGLDQWLESPRYHRDQHLVRALPWDKVLSVLRAIDLSTLKGRRDYAMLLLIATYGLRRGEVASLTLDDIQWRAQVIRVPRPKVGTPLAVPLTDEVATALLAYLRDRASESATRQLFLRVRAPRGHILPSAVGDAFDFWAARADVRMPGLGGPHTLRHGVAMNLLRLGTSLKTIGDLLGHRSAESTGIYLRLQLEDLRDVALPLPAVGSHPEVRL
jgi:integrase/recombinase XerD